MIQRKKKTDQKSAVSWMPRKSSDLRRRKGLHQMLLTGHLRSLPARSFEDHKKKKKKRLWDSLVNFSIKRFHLGCPRSDSSSNGSQVAVAAAVAAGTGPAAVVWWSWRWCNNSSSRGGVSDSSGTAAVWWWCGASGGGGEAVPWQS